MGMANISDELGIISIYESLTMLLFSPYTKYLGTLILVCPGYYLAS